MIKMTLKEMDEYSERDLMNPDELDRCREWMEAEFCLECGGSKMVDMEPCPRCEGTGKVT